MLSTDSFFCRLFSGAKRQPHRQKKTGNFVAKQSTNRYEYTWVSLQPSCSLKNFPTLCFIVFISFFPPTVFRTNILAFFASSHFAGFSFSLLHCFSLGIRNCFPCVVDLTRLLFVFKRIFARMLEEDRQRERKRRRGEKYHKQRSLDACRANACHALVEVFLSSPIAILCPVWPGLWRCQKLLAVIRCRIRHVNFVNSPLR